jgi:chromosome partitioning protein
VQKIIVLNPKGGSGKTTLATNLAAYYASAGGRVTLMDYEPQGSSARWVASRSSGRPTVTLVKAFERNIRTTRSWQLHSASDATHIIVDTAAGTTREALEEFTRDAHAVVIPVLPSEIDIHAASRCIGDLLLCTKIKPRDGRIGVVANRVKKNTKVYQALLRFLRTLEIPFIASLRDAQSYVHAAGLGEGIFELPEYKVRADLESWRPLIDWLHSPATRSAVEQTATSADH